MADEEKKGLLQTCMDKRFVAPARAAFEEATGLGPEDYWHQADAGGAPAFTERPLGADYAYKHGARVLGWGAHGDTCGGQPGKSNEEIETLLDETIDERRGRYPDAEHYRVFSTEAGTTVTKVE